MANRELIYLLLQVSADYAQLARALIRGDTRGVKRNLKQIDNRTRVVRKLFHDIA